MKLNRKSIGKIIQKNPQIDVKLLEKALKEAREMQLDGGKMVKFNIRLPYSSDGYENSVQNCWKVV